MSTHSHSLNLHSHSHFHLGQVPAAAHNGATSMLKGFAKGLIFFPGTFIVPLCMSTGSRSNWSFKIEEKYSRKAPKRVRIAFWLGTVAFDMTVAASIVGLGYLGYQHYHLHH